MNGDAQHDEQYAEQIARAGDLRQHDCADDGPGGDRVTGEDCFIAKAHVASMKVFDEIIPYAMTNTSIIQSSPVKRRLPPLPKAAR